MTVLKKTEMHESFECNANRGWNAQDFVRFTRRANFEERNILEYVSTAESEQ